MRKPWWFCSWATAPACFLDVITFCMIKPICKWHDRLITAEFTEEIVDDDGE